MLPPELQRSNGSPTTIIMFISIIINKENLKNMSVTLSSLRSHDADGNPYTDSEGNPFSFYWLTFTNKTTGTQMICCTGKKFTEALGTTADDAKAVAVIKATAGQFQISQATDEDGDPIFINDDEDTPLLKIQAVAHSVDLDW